MTNKTVKILRDHKGQFISTMTHNQTRYVESIQDYKVTIGVAPAGSGKTFLAIAKAIQLLKNHSEIYKKIILTRPVVEAGEKLGFLPGTFQEKLAPYLVPLQDSIDEILPKDDKLRECISIRALAYLRGSTFKKSIVILDEASCTTPEQMKMFLTRLGKDSKLVINGDLTQSDLKGRNGLEDILERINTSKSLTIKELNVVEFDDNDIVRDPIVKQIINLYKEKEESL